MKALFKKKRDTMSFQADESLMALRNTEQRDPSTRYHSLRMTNPVIPSVAPPSFRPCGGIPFRMVSFRMMNGE
jgi:hypothetical protein